MKADLKEQLKQMTTLGRLMNGEKMTTDDVVKMGILTLTDCEVVEKSEDERWGVMRFKEAPDSFYMSGATGTSICRRVEQYAAEDGREVSEVLMDEPIRLMFSWKRSKAGRDYVQVEVTN